MHGPFEAIYHKMWTDYNTHFINWSVPEAMKFSNKQDNWAWIEDGMKRSVCWTKKLFSVESNLSVTCVVDLYDHVLCFCLWVVSLTPVCNAKASLIRNWHFMLLNNHLGVTSHIMVKWNYNVYLQYVYCSFSPLEYNKEVITIVQLTKWGEGICI